jgi:hypothetical protein
LTPTIHFFEHLERTEIAFDLFYTDEDGEDFEKKIVQDLNIYKDLIFFIKKN